MEGALASAHLISVSYCGGGSAPLPGLSGKWAEEVHAYPVLSVASALSRHAGLG